MTEAKSPSGTRTHIRNQPRRWPRAIGKLSVSGFLAGGFLVIATIAALAPQLFTHADPDDGEPLDILLPPSASHLFGTDQNGRDIYSRIVHGAAPSLVIGVSATALAVVAGVVIGVLAARGGRLGDWVVSRFLDVFLAIPGLLLVFVIVASRGPGVVSTIIGVAIIAFPGYARLVRAEVIRLRGALFVEAARTMGWSRASVIVRHIVPNALGPVLVLAALGVGTAISVASALSFLGLGPQPPTAEWGNMLSSSRTYFAVAWWTAVFPGLAITLTVLSATALGRRLQRQIDGRNV